MSILRRLSPCQWVWYQITSTLRVAASTIGYISSWVTGYLICQPFGEKQLRPHYNLENIIKLYWSMYSTLTAMHSWRWDRNKTPAFYHMPGMPNVKLAYGICQQILSITGGMYHMPRAYGDMHHGPTVTCTTDLRWHAHDLGSGDDGGTGTYAVLCFTVIYNGSLWCNVKYIVTH